MRRFGLWLLTNLDGAATFAIAATVALLAYLDVAGTEQIEAAVLLTLALIAATLLRDRKLAANALAQGAAVRLVNGAEVERLEGQAHRTAGSWIFRGGTGSHLRAVTLRACVDAARRDNRPVRIQVEIIDPTDEQLCRRYAEYRGSLGSGSGGGGAGGGNSGKGSSPERMARGAFATILAICWYRQRFVLLQPDVGLSRTMTTFRWDISPAFALMTQEDSSAPSILFDKDMSHYRAYLRELSMSFEQARRLDITRAEEVRLSDQPTVEEVRRLFGLLRLDLPGTITDNDVVDIIGRAGLPGGRISW